MSKIKQIKASTIYNSRSIPTIEVEVELENGLIETASVPSGKSIGYNEAKELRDEDEKRFSGQGVNKAILNIKKIISPEIINMEVTEQRAIDQKMIELDGTEDKSKLGGNAILGVSLAVAKAAARDLKIPLYKYFGKLFGADKPHILPVPMMNFINGGKVAQNNLIFQGLMVMPLGASSFKEALRIGVETFHNLNKILKDEKYDFGVGDEGGFSPFFGKKDNTRKKDDIKRIKEAIDLIIKAVKKSGYKPYEHIVIALDVASSTFYQEKGNEYDLEDEGKKRKKKNELVDFYSELISEYPIASIEDGMAENDLEGWTLLTRELGNRIQLVGDNLFGTNPNVFKKIAKQNIANAINIMELGTLSEILETIRIAKDLKYNIVISHRSGETEDTTISDLAVGTNAGQIKAGGLSRSERTAKYNQLLRIEEDLSGDSIFLAHKVLSKFEKLAEHIV